MRTKLYTALIALVATASVGLTQGWAREQWARYSAPDYGFSMLVPVGTRLVEGQQFGGWGELWAVHQGVKVFAIIKLGEQASRKEIEKVGVRITGIPGSEWTTIGSGRDVAGFNWYRTVKAVRNGKLFLGDYGTGKMGSYLLVLETTPSDFKQYNADYRKWYQSIRLH